MRTVFITGAGGFLGSILVKALSELKDVKVIASTGDPAKMSTLADRENVKVVQRSFIDSAEFCETEIDCLINCAYPRNSSGFDIADGLRYLEHTFERIRVGKVASVINISSQSVYDGQRTEPADESSPLCLNDPYSIGKYFSERLLDNICTDVPCTHLRMASLIGAGFNQRIVNRFVEKALKMEPITVVRSAQRFGFLDVRDAANAIIAVLNTASAVRKPLYNVGGEKCYSVEELISEIQMVFNERKLDFPQISYTDDDVKSGTSALNCRMLMNDTGFKPVYDIRNSIEAILDGYLSE